MSDEDYDEEYAEETEKLNINPATGMPHMDEEEADASVSKSALTLPILLLVPRIVTGFIALGIYKAKQDQYEARFKKQVLMTEGIGYLFLAGVVFSICVEIANAFPMIYKSAVMPGNAGNLRANMTIYKVQQPSTPYVVMETEGRIGQYNRANRAMYHLVENGMQTLVCLLLAGVVFGEAVFVLAVIYAIGRLWYQIAYSSGGYGFGCCKHAVPFIIHTAIVAHTLEMLVLLAGVRMTIIASATVTTA